MTFTKEAHYYKNRVNTSDVPTDVVIGDLSGTKFIPQADFSKWNGEAWLKVSYPIPQSTEDAVYDSENDKIALTIGDTVFQWYLHPDESLEFEIVLGSKPPGNKNTFTLNLDFPAGLEFLYQDTLENDYARLVNPPFTLAEYLQNYVRPDNVVGSYAVYWNQANGAYKTGKFCHIYRPKLTDALGDSVWGTLSIDPVAKTMTIATTSAWLRNATYPVIIDPTFGYTSKGAGYEGTTGYDFCTRKATTTEAGTVTALHIWCFNYGSSIRNCKVAMYDDDSGPDDRFATPEVIQITDAEGWEPDHPTGVDKSVAYSGTIVASTTYWFGFNHETEFNVFYDSGVAGDRVYASRAYADALPDPFTGGGGNDAYRYSMYCDYTAAAGGAVYSPPDIHSISSTSGNKNGIGNIDNISTWNRKKFEFSDKEKIKWQEQSIRPVRRLKRHSLRQAKNVLYV